MTYKQTTRYPLVDCHSDHLSKSKHARLFIVESLSLVNSFEEESLERLERVLIHVVDDIQSEEQEVKCGTLSCYASVCLTELVDGLLGDLGFLLLTLNFS